MENQLAFYADFIEISPSGIASFNVLCFALLSFSAGTFESATNQIQFDFVFIFNFALISAAFAALAFRCIFS